MEADNSVTTVSWSPTGDEIAIVTIRTVVIVNVVTETVVTTIPVEPGVTVTNVSWRRTAKRWRWSPESAS